MGPIKAALGDMVLTGTWVFFAATFGLMTTTIVDAIGAQSLAWAPTVVITVIVFVFVFVFTLIGDALGGAGFNPTGNAAFYAAGVGGDTLLSMAIRVPAQALGAVGGTVAIMEVIPTQYKHLIGGPSLKVDPHTGAIAEAVLTFLITFAVLVIILRGPTNAVIRTWLLAVSTVVLIVAGGDYTGPAMNPAIALGWGYIYNSHNTWDHLYVYWICPFIGAILAAWVFRALFPPPVVVKKQKKA